MTSAIILPTFASEADRLTFLSRLWGITLTSQDVANWEAYKLLRPIKIIAESESEFSERCRLWHEGRVTHPPHYILAKYEVYGLGKVKPAVETYLSTRPSPNRTQARQAILLQLQAKWADRIALITPETDLSPLVTGIVW